VRECTFPLTARGAVDVVVTEQAVFRVRDGSLVLTELLGEATVGDVSSVTEARFTIELED
jgi:3-oxoacid CoA-transferase